MALSDTEKNELLKIARFAIEAAVSGRTAPEFNTGSSGLNADSGAFVTIHKKGRLRGCIGTFSSPDPLYKTVIVMARSAALKDPRFSPVSPEELASIDIEISVLSPLKEIKDVSEIVVGKHGLYIVCGRNRGVLLPQVAVECGFDRDTFLDETCMKAGVSPDSWKKGATIFTFEAEIFREKSSKET